MQATTNDNEQAYFISFQNGEEEGFSYFFLLHYESLLFYAKRLLRDNMLAEDIVEDSFLKFFEKRGAIQSESTIKGFLYVTVRNACLDRFQRIKTKEKHQKEISSLTPITQLPVIEELIRTETLSIVLKAMEELPPATRKVFKMLYIEGKNYDEISKELNRSKETIRKQRNQGLLYLKKRLLLFFLFLLFHLPAFHSMHVL